MTESATNLYMIMKEYKMLKDLMPEKGRAPAYHITDAVMMERFELSWLIEERIWKDL